MSNEIWPDIAIPPGEILLDTINAMSISQAELARRTGRPVQAINEIIKGTKRIEPETAFQLERALGTPAHVWLNLQKNFEFNKARLNDRATMESQVRRLQEFPYPAMVKLGWVQRFRKPAEKVQELLKFFGVASFDAHEKTQAAFRKSYLREANRGALDAWLRKGKLNAGKIQTHPYNHKELQESLYSLRRLTVRPVNEFRTDLVKTCASCGVAVVFVPELPRSYVSGATYWIAPDKAVIQLSLRFKTDDHFWFSLFHEIGHIIKHGKRLFLDDWKRGDEYEEQANHFAANILIPQHPYNEFVRRQPFSRQRVISFARQMRIAPGIVVGRLQYDSFLPYTHLNNLKKRYNWSFGKE